MQQNPLITNLNKNYCEVPIKDMEQKEVCVDTIQFDNETWIVGELCNGNPVYYSTTSDRAILDEQTIVGGWALVIASNIINCSVEAASVLATPPPTDPEALEVTQCTINQHTGYDGNGDIVVVYYTNIENTIEYLPQGATPKKCVDCDPFQKEGICYYVKKQAAIRPFGDASDLTGTGPITNFAGQTLDGLVQGTWETTTPTYGSGPMQFGGITNWHVSMFNSGSGIYNNTMRLNLWETGAVVLNSYIRMTDIDFPNGSNDGEIYNIGQLFGYSSISEYTSSGAPSYYPFGTYSPVTLGTQGTFDAATGYYYPNNTTSGAGLQTIYNGTFSNQVISASTDQGGQSVVWMFVEYLSPLRVEYDCNTQDYVFFDDSNFDEQAPYDTDGNPVLSSVEVPFEEVVQKQCTTPSNSTCCNEAFDPYGDCDIESAILIRCVDGDQTVKDIDGNDVTLLDGDEIAYNTLTCGNLVVGFSIVSINNSTVQIALPAPASPIDPDTPPFNTMTCDPAPEIFGPECMVDEKGQVWDEYQIVSLTTGVTFIYIDEKGNTGTPIGELTACADEDCYDTEVICYCVSSKGSVKTVKSEVKKRSEVLTSRKVKEQDTKAGKVLDICEERRYDCQGNYVYSTYLYQGRQFTQEQVDKFGIQQVPCDSPDVTYSPAAVTCAVEDRVIEGVNVQVVLNCQVFTNDADPTDLFTQYTLADDYTTEGIGSIGDIYTPLSELSVVGCPCSPNCITEDEDCYRALVSIKGVANVGDTINVVTLTNSQSGTTIYLITHSTSGALIYQGTDPLTDAGINLSDNLTWDGPTDCDAEVETPQCCPVVQEACMIVDGKVSQVIYSIYPDTAQINWIKDIVTGVSQTVPKKGWPEFVDCCEDPLFTACTQIDVFDTFDLGTLNAGGMREISLEIDGTIVSTIPHDYLTTNDGVSKSSWYTPWVAAINALAGWSFTLLEDKGVNVSGNAGLSGNGKVTWTLEYSGTTPQRIRIYVGDVGNSLTTDFLEMDVTGQDTFTTSTGENNTVNIWSTYPFRNC